MIDRETSARRAAEMLGITFEELKANPNILKLFIFLHEVGHAQDYIANYMKNPQRESDPDYDPLTENQKQRDTEMASLPIPMTNPVQTRQFYDQGKLAPYFEEYKAHFRNMGINSAEELLLAQEQAYRELPSEKYADTFATETLRKNWERLELDQTTEEPPSV